MMDKSKEKEYYQEMANLLDNLIPGEWTRTVLYAEASEDKVFFTFYFKSVLGKNKNFSDQSKAVITFLANVYRILLFVLGTFCTVLATSLLSVSNACSIQYASDNVITNTRQVSNSATTNKNYAVFLQVVAFSGNIASTFFTVGTSDSRDFTESRVRFFR